MLPTVAEEVYDDGKTIIEEGTSGGEVYLIRSGTVEISKTIKGKKCIIATLEAGELFGELSFFQGAKRTATARTVGETRIEIVDRTYLKGEFEKLSPELQAILQALVKRFQQTIDRATDLSVREEPRIPKTLSLKYANKKAVVDALTENASSRGLFVSTEDPLQEGEQLQIELQLPGLEDPVKVKGQVVWTRPKTGAADEPSGMGIKFIEITKDDKQLLKEYLNA
jgi:uncharacterized protein (TIGR02266 family)